MEDIYKKFNKPTILNYKDKKVNLKKKGFWYLATPYANVEDPNDFHVPLINYLTVSSFTARLISEGVPVYSPITYNHLLQTMNRNLWTNLTVSDWLDFDELFFSKAVGLIVLMSDGWEKSEGIKTEVQCFMLKRKPIIMVGPGDSVKEIRDALYNFRT